MNKVKKLNKTTKTNEIKNIMDWGEILSIIAISILIVIAFRFLFLFFRLNPNSWFCGWFSAWALAYFISSYVEYKATIIKTKK